ncbi:MAG: hypothetical protein M0006_03830 [Magnetospirillum sp.]|nr:hypothetical protein [Magnetospirillum sp.]
MERDVAERISALMEHIIAELDTSIHLVKEKSPDDFIQYRLAAGRIMGYIDIEILSPIHRDYPDLSV